MTNLERPSTTVPADGEQVNITEQLGRLLPLVNGGSRVARVNSTHAAAALPSLLSWDDDGHLSVD
ncbi:hypothetical protein [Vulcanococcus sp.]|jgi:hypothetical protein|uniref:hypothetical protein n=1 Tax=Vulcanococcus sp. TaxID=2856995 RepID=UPI003C09A724